MVNGICTICGGTSVQPFLKAKDYTATGEVFEIYSCNTCNSKYTANAPMESECGKYYDAPEYISHTETKEGFVNKVYHLVRNITLRDKRNLVQSQTKRKTGALLDIGCGTGAFAGLMHASGWKVMGLEPSLSARLIALQQHRIEVLSSEELYNLKEGYDAITMWHVLEHVYDLNGYFKQMHRLLNDNGTLFIAVPNYTSGDARTYKAFWAAWDVPRHLYHFSPQSINFLAERHGFKVVKRKGMWFDSVYVSLLSEKYKKGSAVKGVFNGFLSNINAMFDVTKCSSVIYILKKQ